MIFKFIGTKQVFLIIIFLFFGIIIGGGIGYFAGFKSFNCQIETSMEVPKEIFMRAGEVVKIEENTIHLRAKVLGGEIDSKTGETKTEILKVSVDPNTKIN